MSKDYNQLPQVAFSILLALSLRERHGYEIIKQAEDDSDGKIKLGPGALYTSIKHLRNRGLILEVKRTNDTRRRYYKLSASGLATLQEELDYYENVVALARKRQTLKSRHSIFADYFCPAAKKLAANDQRAYKSLAQTLYRQENWPQH